MTTSMIISAVLLGAGFLFMLISLIGIVRLPDFFARLHSQGVGDTVGAFLMLAGMMVAAGAGLLSVKILLIFIIIVLTNPIGTNLMMIAAINSEDYQGYRTFMEGGSPEESSSAQEPTDTVVQKPSDAAMQEPADGPETGQKERDRNRNRNRRRKPSMNMNKAELELIAAERGVEVPEGATKREILNLIYSKHDKNHR